MIFTTWIRDGTNNHKVNSIMGKTENSIQRYGFNFEALEKVKSPLDCYNSQVNWDLFENY